MVSASPSQVKPQAVRTALRLIARLDIKGPNLIKGIQLEGLRVIGDPQTHAQNYYAQGADEVVEVQWHPIMDLLANPNGHMSGQEYDLLLWDHELTGGTAFEYVVESGQPVALLPLYPVWVTPQPSA